MKKGSQLQPDGNVQFDYILHFERKTPINVNASS